MRWKLVLPWRYLVMLALGLVVLWLLVWRFGRTDVVLIGWLLGWLGLSRSVDYLMRRKRTRWKEEEERSPR